MKNKTAKFTITTVLSLLTLSNGNLFSVPTKKPSLKENNICKHKINLKNQPLKSRYKSNNNKNIIVKQNEDISYSLEVKVLRFLIENTKIKIYSSLDSNMQNIPMNIIAGNTMDTISKHNFESTRVKEFVKENQEELKNIIKIFLVEHFVEQNVKNIILKYAPKQVKKYNPSIGIIVGRIANILEKQYPVSLTPQQIMTSTKKELIVILSANDHLGSQIEDDIIDIITNQTVADSIEDETIQDLTEIEPMYILKMERGIKLKNVIENMEAGEVIGTEANLLD